MLSYLNRAVPIETLLSDDDPETRQFVERVLDIRRFATEELGLKESSNYTRYVALDRDYLAAVVSGSAKDSFTRHYWWFPVVGRLPYKGFFNSDHARREAERLRRRDLDVLVRQVDAFSTLGWFSDPLFSYMRNYPVYRLADLIIHETVHATVYLRGHSQFNEELAEFIGSEAARFYMERTFGIDSEEYQQMLTSQADTAAFVGFLQSLIAELEVLYNSDKSREEKLEQREVIIQNAQRRFDEEYDNLFLTDNFRAFSSRYINNAYLDLYRLYYSGGSYLRELYERSGSDLPRFIAAAKSLSPRRNPLRQLEDALLR